MEVQEIVKGLNAEWFTAPIGNLQLTISMYCSSSDPTFSIAWSSKVPAARICSSVWFAAAIDGRKDDNRDRRLDGLGSISEYGGGGVANEGVLSSASDSDSDSDSDSAPSSLAEPVAWPEFESGPDCEAESLDDETSSSEPDSEPEFEAESEVSDSELETS